MSEVRTIYRKCVRRARRAVLDGDRGVIRAVDALFRAIGFELGKTKAEVARDVGLTPQRYFQLVHGDDPAAPARAPANPEGVTIVDVGPTVERDELSR